MVVPGAFFPNFRAFRNRLSKLMNILFPAAIFAKSGMRTNTKENHLS